MCVLFLSDLWAEAATAAMEEIKQSFQEKEGKITDIRQQTVPAECFQKENEYNFGTLVLSAWV